MNDKQNFRSANFPAAVESAPLRTMDAAAFANLGAGKVVFLRPIRGADLTRMIPTSAVPEEAVFNLLLSAEGQPVMVADSYDAVSEWLDDNDLILVTRH